MKRFLAVLLTLAMLLGVMSLSLASFAAEGETKYVEKELTLDEGKNYAFYAQTRKTNTEGFVDVRIIIVANEAWLMAEPTASVDLIFTDGTTPVTKKDLTFDTVFKQITAAGEKEGTTDRYTTAEGVVMFGWVVTGVPEAYANLENNAPRAVLKTAITSVVLVDTVGDKLVVNGTLGGDAKDKSDGPSLTMTNGQDNNNAGSATFTLNGNYEGLWQLDVYSFGSDASRKWTVTVNGDDENASQTFTFNSFNVGTWNDASKALSWCINVELKNGENTIVVTCPTRYSAHITKIVMNKYEYIEVVDSAVTLSAYYDGVIEGPSAVKHNGTGNEEVGTCVGGMLEKNTNGEKTTLTFTLNGNYKGVCKLDVYSVNWASDRQWKVTVNGEADKAQTFNVIGVDSWYDTTKAVPVSIYVEMKDGFNTIEITSPTGDAPQLAKVVVEKINANTVPTAVPSTSITTISGPKFGEKDTEGNVVENGEGTQKLFDGKYAGSKLCTEDNGKEIILMFNDGAKTLTGIGLCNANDNATNTGRTVVKVKIYVSNDGKTWDTTPAFIIDDKTPKADISTNYLQRYFAFDKAIEAQYVKLVVDNDGKMYQMSEVVFYQ